MRLSKSFLFLLKVFALAAACPLLGESSPNSVSERLYGTMLDSVNARLELEALKVAAAQEKKEMLSQISAMESLNCEYKKRIEDLRKKNQNLKNSLGELSEKLNAEKKALSDFDAFLMSKFFDISKKNAAEELLKAHSDFSKKSASQKLTSLFMLLESLYALDEKGTGVFLEIKTADALKSSKFKGVLEIEVVGNVEK